ncbi:PleD family two-component system response regulator [Actinoplanes sp. NPDC051859]|uniref:PleD family two-component system response regulator n=1 Tax=Actinoplanes sp. NPDC051859 TaxID=3363909 RepID=UPI0037B8F036
MTEEDADLRLEAARALRQAGHTVIIAFDGAQALAAIREHRPEAAVLAADMLIMSGVQVCRMMREDDDLRHIPVLLTRAPAGMHEMHIPDAGATAVLAGPVTSTQLVQCLNGLLQENRTVRLVYPAI